MARFRLPVLSTLSLLLVCFLVAAGKMKVLRERQKVDTHPYPKGNPAFAWPRSPTSLIEILTETLDRKGLSLRADPSKRDKIRANQESIVPIILCMVASFEAAQLRSINWERLQSIQKAYLKLADGVHATKGIPHIISTGLNARRKIWLRLVDSREGRNALLSSSTKEQGVLLLPSSNLEHLCQDPVNRPKILRRFHGVVGYTMILAATTMMDEIRLAPLVATFPDEVMSKKEYSFQQRCLSYAVDRLKKDILAGDTIPDGSVIDLADRVLKLSTVHLHERTEVVNELEELSRWMDNPLSTKDYFKLRLDKLRDPEDGIRKIPWPQPHYTKILRVARRVNDVFEMMFLDGAQSSASAPSDEDIRLRLLAWHQKLHF